MLDYSMCMTTIVAVNFLFSRVSFVFGIFISIFCCFESGFYFKVSDSFYAITDGIYGFRRRDICFVRLTFCFFQWWRCEEVFFLLLYDTFMSFLTWGELFGRRRDFYLFRGRRKDRIPMFFIFWC